MTKFLQDINILNLLANTLTKKNLISFLGQKLNRLRPNRFTKKYEYVGIEEEKAVEMKRCINSDLNQILINPLNNSYSMAQKKLSPIQIISKYEIDNYLLNTLLRDNDVLSMAHSLEVRPVLLDHKLVELIFSLTQF